MYVANYWGSDGVEILMGLGLWVITATIIVFFFVGAHVDDYKEDEDEE